MMARNIRVHRISFSLIFAMMASAVFSSGSGMQVRLPSHVWFWGQFCSESVLAAMTNQHAKILPCLWDSLRY